MYTFVKPFIDLALFKRAPQDLPESVLLMGVVLTTHALLGVVYFLQGNSVFESLLAGVTGTALLALLTGSLLLANGLRARVVRTLTAIAGVDIVIGVLSLPLSGWLHRNAQAGAAADPSPADGIASLLFLALLMWNLGAAGHVLRHALAAPLAMGVVLALVFYVISITVMKVLIPGTG